MPCPFCKKEHEYTFEQALDMLQKGPQLIREAMAGAGEREASFADPKPGGWSPAQVAAHLMDCEIVYSMRFRKILAEDDAVLPAFDEKKWATALQNGRDLGEVLTGFEVLRRQNLALVRNAPQGALDRAGTHPEYGRLTVRDHIIHLGQHDANHAAQIRRIRATYSGGSAARA